MFAGSLEFSQHRGITGVPNRGIEIGLGEIEEGPKVGVAAVFSLLLSALCDFAQERQHFVGCEVARSCSLSKWPQSLARVAP